METALALAVPDYAPPALVREGALAETDDVVWWAVFVGFAYGLALAWAAWCRYTGGNPEISFGWSGFKIACKS